MAIWDEFGWDPGEGYKFKHITPGHEQMQKDWDALVQNDWRDDPDGFAAAKDAFSNTYGAYGPSMQEAMDNEGYLGDVVMRVQQPGQAPSYEEMMNWGKNKDEVEEGGGDKPKEKKKKKEAPLAWPKPKSQADIEADMGRHSTGGVDWNVGLGNVGGWDLSTQGSFNRGGEDRHGIKDKDNYNVRLNAARGMDWNKMLGAAPLGGPAAKGRYSDYEGGEYKPREMGSRLSTSEVERGRKPAPMAGNDPLAPYLAAGIDPDQAAMLLANKVPPPPARRAMGGPIYANQGRYAIRGVPQLQQQKGLMGHAMDFGKGKALDYGLEMMFPGAGIAKDAASYIAPRMLEKGGEAKPWWKKAADYAWGTGREGERAKQAMQGKRKAYGPNNSAIGEAVATTLLKGALGFSKGGDVPTYKAMGGMTPGPLGMTDMVEAGKDKSVSKVKYKKTGGKVSDEMEISYHAPLAPKGE